MSSIENNGSNMFFPTQTNLSIPQEYGSLSMRKSISPGQRQQVKQPSLSSILYKTKDASQNTKQRLISPQLQSIITKIQTFVNDIDSKIQNRVQLVKQVYIDQYKQQVLEMSTQLKNLREKLDNEVMKQRANEKMFYLEEERDFFRHQVIKLNEQMNKLNEENKQLKKVLEQEKRESENYKKIVYNLESKLIKIKSINLQKHSILNSNNSDQKHNKNQPSNIESAYRQDSGGKTERVQNSMKKPSKSLQTIEDEEEREMSRTGYRLGGSQSLKGHGEKFSTPGRVGKQGMLRSTGTVSYPKLRVQRLEKIQGYSQLLERQQIIDECLNELKREIYYRNLAVGDKESKLHFGEAGLVKFQAFTKTDKKQLIVKLLSNDKILHDFYSFLFNPQVTLSGRNPQDPSDTTARLISQKLDAHTPITSHKLSLKKLKFQDPKFQSHLLNTAKTQFNKKIYDIKHTHRV